MVCNFEYIFTEKRERFLNYQLSFDWCRYFWRWSLLGTLINVPLKMQDQYQLDRKKNFVQ